MSEISDSSPINKAHLWEGDGLNLLSVGLNFTGGDGTAVKAVAKGIGTIAGITGTALIVPEEVNAVSNWGQLSNSDRLLAAGSAGTSIAFLGSSRTASVVRLDRSTVKDAIANPDNQVSKDLLTTGSKSADMAAIRNKFALFLAVPSAGTALYSSVMNQVSDSSNDQQSP